MFSVTYNYFLFEIKVKGQYRPLTYITNHNTVFTASSNYIKQLECGAMHNVMAAMPNTGGALCSTPQSLADANY